MEGDFFFFVNTKNSSNKWSWGFWYGLFPKFWETVCENFLSDYDPGVSPIVNAVDDIRYFW